MAKRNEHLVVVMMEPLAAEIEFELWPQHITIVPWFPCKDPRRLGKTLASAAGRHKPFEAIAGQIETWGDGEKFDVITIEDPANKLHDLHQDVFHSLEINGFPIHQKDFLGSRYRPHITLKSEVQKKQTAPELGQSIGIAAITLISQERLKKSGRMIKRVVKEYPLNG